MMEKNTKKFLYDLKGEIEKLKEKTDEELIFYTQKLKNSSNNLIPWFALVQEISSRSLGLRHFETQLLAGLYLTTGNVVEMKTGEGKTLASTLAISYKALEKKGVHVVTVNEYLAERDEKWMGKLYKNLGLTSGLVKSTNTFLEKKKSYNADITYLTNSELVFDYLRDCTAYTSSQLVQRPLSFGIIDEIDSILIDEARTPLILSSAEENKNKGKFFKAKQIASTLEKDKDFLIDDKIRDISLTEKGYQKVQKFLGKKTLYDPYDAWVFYIVNSLKASYIFKKNKDYIVNNGKILIVDEFTGRIMEDRRWSMGIHEAIETKENLELGGITKTKVSITYQNFFPLYPCFSGMTGTAKTIEKELKSIYNLKIVAIPTMKPLVRKDLSDNVFIDQSSKWKAVVEQSKKCFLEGQPLLVGTTSIEKSEFLSQLFKFANIPHELLNAKPENLKRENEIIAQAGKRYAVTIATNMAGRGTDIILGGNLDFEVSRKILEMFSKKTVEMDIIKKEYGPQEDLLFSDIQNLPYSLEDSRPSLRALYKKLLESATLKWKKENKKIKELGGLFVLGTERHETRRIDDQLRGRAGRQGDPGISQFFVSLDDDLLKIFGGSNLQNWMRYFTTEQDGPLESSFLTNSIEKAQEKVENFNYEIRKNLYEYDEILNLQAKIFFSSRKELLFQNMSKFFLYSKENHFDTFSSFSNLSFTQEFGSYSKFIFQKNSNFCSKYQYFWTQNHKNFIDLNSYHLSFSYQNFFILVDNIWNRHIEQVAYMRDTVTWKSYGQQNPLTEYNLTSFKFFSHLFQNLRKIIINFL